MKCIGIESTAHTFSCSVVNDKGEILSEKNITIKRPGYGIEPKNYNIVKGRTAKVNIKEDEWITWDKI